MKGVEGAQIERSGSFPFIFQMADKKEKLQPVAQGRQSDKQTLKERWNAAIDWAYDHELKPRLLEALDRTASGFIHFFLFRNGQSKSTSGVINITNFTDYAATSNSGDYLSNKYGVKTEKPGGYKPLAFDSYSAADSVLEALKNACAAFDGICKVADLYDLAGVLHTGEIQYEKIGWDMKGLAKAKIEYTDAGYTLTMPRPIDISKLM